MRKSSLMTQRHSSGGGGVRSSGGGGGGGGGLGVDGAGGREVSAMQVPGPPKQLEPTYRMEPQQRFLAPRVHVIIKDECVRSSGGGGGGGGGLGVDGAGGREVSAMQVPGPPKQLEPTYRMEPQQRFLAPRVHVIIKETLEKHLDGFQFNPKFTATMSKVLSEELKDRVKQLGFDPRYKLVSTVVIGQRLDQGVVITSRCAWDVRLDSYAAYTYQNKSLFCTASVYGLYRE
ncbi:dynein light chain Tctex-type 5-like [Babylonia areolata]|uniref:dynein light chain Tctex-type 5-like n=1 Tax=Babylonia areolata TaxID=304850 RepID=UPI003FD24CCA